METVPRQQARVGLEVRPQIRPAHDARVGGVERIDLLVQCRAIRLDRGVAAPRDLRDDRDPAGAEYRLDHAGVAVVERGRVDVRPGVIAAVREADVAAREDREPGVDPARPIAGQRATDATVLVGGEVARPRGVDHLSPRTAAAARRERVVGHPSFRDRVAEEDPVVIDVRARVVDIEVQEDALVAR